MLPLARWLGGLAIGAAAVLTAVFTAAVVWTVFSRYGLGRTPIWAEELPRLLLVWAAFLGAGGAEARAGHLSAGLLALVLGEGRVGRVAAGLGDVAVIGFSAVVVWATVQFVAIAGGGTTTALALPASVFYWAVGVGAGLIAFGATARLLSRL